MLKCYLWVYIGVPSYGASAHIFTLLRDVENKDYICIPPVRSNNVRHNMLPSVQFSETDRRQRSGSKDASDILSFIHAKRTCNKLAERVVDCYFISVLLTSLISAH